MKTDKDFLEIAAKDAEKGMKKGDGGPFGAVIVKNGKIIATAHNTVLKSCNPTSHAEINAIHIASKQKKHPFFEGCTIYSTTEPCPMCFSAIHWGRFNKVVFGTSIQDVKKLGFNELSISNINMKRWGKSPLKINQIKSLPCQALLAKWKVLPHKKTY